MPVCRRNRHCIAHLAGFISDKDYYALYVPPLDPDYTGDGARKRADEQRKLFLENAKRNREQKQTDNSLIYRHK